jgi:hypothetical protein
MAGWDNATQLVLSLLAKRSVLGNRKKTENKFCLKQKWRGLHRALEF